MRVLIAAWVPGAFDPEQRNVADVVRSEVVGGRLFGQVDVDPVDRARVALGFDVLDVEERAVLVFREAVVCPERLGDPLIDRDRHACGLPDETDRLRGRAHQVPWSIGVWLGISSSNLEGSQRDPARAKASERMAARSR